MENMIIHEYQRKPQLKTMETRIYLLVTEMKKH